MYLCSFFFHTGSSILVILLAGYWAQHYLPPPKPKIVGIDLGTTYSCIGMYHAVSGKVDILETQDGHKCIPSVVAFSEEGVLVGYKAVAQAEHNPKNTIYDAKRFIGKKFTKEELEIAQKQYSFKVSNFFYIWENSLKQMIKNLSAPVTKVVMSVPAEFDQSQRNYTKKAASMSGLDVFRIINEPTAAALAYGLHTKPGLRIVLVVDLGGGTLDVSLLRVQGGMFLTQAMAGNNRLGGQDFNMRLLEYLKDDIENQFNQKLTDKEDLQTLRLAVEEAKINLTHQLSTDLHIHLHSLGNKNSYKRTITRSEFEKINMDLFKKVLEPIRKVLESVELPKEEVDEIVLVGGSTRIPNVRKRIQKFFGKDLNTAIDPELAVATGVSIQAGIIGGMWPLTVSAVELQNSVQKIHTIYIFS
ncbi:hypothetical protein KUTeg_005361, partial [Tegillarca granosa]